MLLEGRGAPRDPLEAASWLSRAAEAGDAGAAYLLGAMSESGDGVPMDRAAAVDRYLEAAAKGDPDGACRAAELCLEEPPGGKVAGAVRSALEAASEAGHPAAAWRLADALWDGRLFPRDRGKALELHALAAETGGPRARFAYAARLLEPPVGDGALEAARGILAELAEEGFPGAREILDGG
jgi:TPR repeat protein